MEKRKASINIQKAHIGEFWHNTREKPTKNSIFDKSQNEYDNDAKIGIELYKKDLEEKTKKYTERTGQKLQKNAITLMNAVVNLNENHTLQDLKKVAKMLEEKLDVKVYQIAVHRDEGYVDEKGKHINYHGHILFSGLDSEGRAIKRNKLNIHVLKQLQTEVAKILNMERGQPSKNKRKHLDIYTYKQVKKAESELIKELNKGLKLTDKKINKYLKIVDKKLNELANVFGNVKKQDVLNLFNKFLKSLKLKNQQLEEKNEKLEKENQELKQKLSEKNFKLHELEFDYEKLKQENKELFNRIQNFQQADTYEVLKENKTLKKENSELKLTVKELKEELSNLRKQLIQVNKQMEINNKEKIFTKEDYMYLSELKKQLKANNVKEIYEKLKEYKKEINQKTKERGIDF